MPKYVITTGGVISGLGKGIVSASIGKLLQSYGYSVTMVKIDPYVNIDAGTMNPFEHGEVFVLNDGGEVDMDLGNYERFLNTDLTWDHNITTGKVYKAVIDKERKGDYLGKDVQIVPDITDEIKKRIRKMGEGKDVVVVELGGTVGDIESMPFLEAVRQLHMDEERGDVTFVHVTLVPVMKVVGEQKTKPTQHSVQKLQQAGIQPDFILCRSDDPLEESTRNKISKFCNVDKEYVISDPNVENLYDVPLVLDKEDLGQKIVDKLGLQKKGDMKEWKALTEKMNAADKTIKIALAGKYTALRDSYVSIIEALNHAGMENGCTYELIWIETQEFEEDPLKVETLKDIHGLIVPGGFGERGVEGKIRAIQYARENKIPYLGLCYGLQLACIEFARNVCGLEGAHTTEIDKSTKYPIVDYLPKMYEGMEMGGTMRLGAWPCKIEVDTLAHKIYGKELIEERHRHRYELNPEFIDKLEEHGLKFSGRSPDHPIMEIGEITDHPFFMGTQFHPEFKSRLESPSPPFVHFVKACLGKVK